ncbi:MAG: DMT family transporter [Coriobacteriia bacterium]|nr:DMT family transporter [Coriobacteriia bacterium]
MELRSPRFKQIASTGIILLAAIIWGLCFVAQRSAMQHIGPFLFNGIRGFLAAFALLLIVALVWYITLKRKAPTRASAPPVSMKYLIGAGLFCGVILFFASNLQQIGMVTVTASKAAFITALYIVLVPVLGLFLKQRTNWNTWVSVGVAVVGLYLLCVSSGFALETGDAVLIGCALFWAFHILAIGHYAPRLTLLQLFGMCVIQFVFSGALSLVCAPLFDGFFFAVPLTLGAVMNAAPELLYAGILSTGVAFTLVAIAQRHAKPTPAAIVMSTESVFGLLGGVLILSEVLTAREGIGCLLMFAAVILTQLKPQEPSELSWKSQ